MSARKTTRAHGLAGRQEARLARGMVGSRRKRAIRKAGVPARAACGQMTVELAVIVPVAIVVGLVAFNLARFSEACAAFDRIAADAVVSQGVAPAGDAGLAATGEVASAIEEALSMHSCEVEVAAEQLSASPHTGPGIGFPVSPLLTRFTCTLNYRPWPGSFVIAGVPYSPPVVLTHTRVLVVDRYRGGVVV